MLPVLILLVAALAVVITGLLFVGWAVNKTTEMPDQIVVDAHEAIEFCAEALPDEVTARISYEDLRKVLRLHLEWIQAFHFAPESSSVGPILFEEFDAVDYILERADVNHFRIDRADVAAVVAAHSSYLQVMGAIHIEDQEVVDEDLAELPLLDAVELESPSAGELPTSDSNLPEDPADA